MKQTCAELKNQARESLLGHYGIFAGMLILIILIVTLLSVPFMRMSASASLYDLPAQFIFGYAARIIVYILSYLLIAGFACSQLNLARGAHVSMADLIFPFSHRPDRYLAYGAAMIGISIGCFLPAVIVYAVFSLRLPSDAGFPPRAQISVGILSAASVIAFILISLCLSQSLYLLLDRENLSLKASFRESARLMKKNKWRLFKLHLSFIGWMILCIPSLFIGCLWTVPYLSQSRALFYLELLSDPQSSGTA